MAYITSSKAAPAMVNKPLNTPGRLVGNENYPEDTFAPLIL